MKWIKFKEKKPKYGERVLAYHPNFNRTKNFIIAVPFIHMDQFPGFTHWMPQPEPPKEPNENNQNT